MGENQVQEVLQNLLGRLKDKQVRRVRVVNLSVSDQRISVDDLTETFESLTLNTVAQGAHLHIRWVNTNQPDLASSRLPPSVHPATIQIDSVELG